MTRFAGPLTWLSDSSLGLAMIDQLAKVSLLLLAAWGLAWMFRNASATARHQIWATALVVVLALPLLSAALPDWHVPILPTLGIPTSAPDVWLDHQPLDQSLETYATHAHVDVAAGIAADAIAGNSLDQNVRSGVLIQEQQAAGGLDLSTWLVLVWATVSLLLLARLLISSLGAWRMVRQSATVTDDQIVADVTRLCQQLGIRSRIELVEHPRITMPMAWGIFRHTILLPMASRSWTEDRRRVVLLHELAHLKRWDCRSMLLARVVTSLYWFNPLAWIAIKRLQAEREHACDDLVLTAGTPGTDYAQHLLDIARSMQPSSSAGWAMVAMARPSELEGRLLAILDPNLARGQASRSARVALLATVALALPLASLQLRANDQPLSSSEALPEASSEARLETLPESLPETPPETRPEVSASRQNNERLSEAFATAIADPDPDIRARAAHSLGSMERAQAVPLLERAVRSDPSNDVRAQAAWALGKIESDTAVPALTEAISDATPEVRQHAAWALGRIESRTAVPALTIAVADDSPDVRQHAVWALGMIESDGAVEILIKALADRESNVRQKAAWALGMIESSIAVSPLTASLTNDDSPEVREQAAWALGMIEDETALDALLDAMSDDSLDVRKRALWAVSHISG